MRLNKFIIAEERVITISYRGLVLSVKIEEIKSLSIIKVQSANILLQLFPGDNYKNYYLKIKTINEIHLKRIRYRDRKQMAREVTKIMDYTFHDRIQRFSLSP